MKRAVAAILTLIVLSGCASSTPPPPSVYVNPTRGQTPEQQVRDQNDCVQIAKQQTGYDPALDTAKGAGVGAAIGAASGGTIGAVGGGVYQHGRGKEGYNQAYGNCMMGRGYSVNK